MPRSYVEGTGDDGYRVAVGWTKGASVQVGTASPHSFTFTEPLPPGVTASDGFSSLWAHLDRRGCNDLIAAIRKARDAAFGRDE